MAITFTPSIAGADGPDRRQVLRTGAILSVLSTGLPAWALNADGRMRIDALICDTRIRWAAPSALNGVRRLDCDGDVTRLWTGILDNAWRKPGTALAGVTGADVLFVLETLAADRQRRVLHRQVLTQEAQISDSSRILSPSDRTGFLAGLDHADITPVFWVIAETSAKGV